MNKTAFRIFIISLIALAPSLSLGQDLKVLDDQIDGHLRRDMMKHYFLNLAVQLNSKWITDYDKRKTPAQITEYQQGLKAKFIEALGGFPERTPLNAQVTGIVKRKGYSVEKIIFESQPKHYVTAVLFIPESPSFKKPYPAVLIPCGHSQVAKGYDLYQRTGALMALNGMAAMVLDPIDQGERSQLLDDNGKAPMWGTRSHTMVGVSSILLGQNTARFMIWDGIRAIDYLQSRPEIDAGKIGCTGNSGGGTQTSHFMAIDDRITAAAPSCYITSFDRILNTIGCQDAEQNIYGQLAFGMDHADYLMMRAPKPTLICCATKDFFDISGVWDSFRYAKRLYSRMGHAERIDLVETDNTHGYSLELRQGAARWMARWLRNCDQPITEPDIELLTEEEFLCTPKGQVMLLDNARSVYDLNIEYNNQLAKQREKLWTKPKKAIEKVRILTGIQKAKKLPKPQTEIAGTIDRTGYTIQKLILIPEKGVYLPTLKFIPHKTSSATVIYLHENGKQTDAAPDGPIEKLVLSGKTVYAVDVRGTGETKQDSQRYGEPYFGKDGQDAYAAYVMGKSFVAMRAEDILIATQYAISQSNTNTVELIATGNIGISALHAAALEPELYESITLNKTLISWSNIIENKLSNNQLINTVHGALKVYDLPDLAASLGDKTTIDQPVDANGKQL